MLRLILVLIFIAISNTSFARSFDINLGSDAAQFKYGSNIGATNFGRTEMHIGFLYNEDDAYLGEIGVLVIDEAGSKTPGLELGVGPKFWFGGSDEADVDISGIGLGGQLRYKNFNSPRVIYGFSLFYAPSIVSFMDSDNILEYDLRVEYELLPTANVYVGYRSIEADIKNRGDVEIDKSGFIGLRFKF